MPSANAAAIAQSMLPSIQCVASVGTVRAAATTSDVPAARAAVNPKATMNSGTSTMPPPGGEQAGDQAGARDARHDHGVRSTRG